MNRKNQTDIPPEIRDFVESTFSDMEVAIEEIKSLALEEVQDYLKNIKKGDQGEKGEQGVRGLDGKDGSNGKDGKQGKKGPRGEAGKDGLSGKDGEKGKDGNEVRPLEIANKLNTLTEQVDMSVIKGLPNYLKKLSAFTKEKPKVQQGGGGNVVQYYDISASLDGVTKTFTVPTHRKIIQVVSSSAPFVFRPTVDYTRTRTSITFDSAIDAAVMLAGGQSIVLIYAN